MSFPYLKGINLETMRFIRDKQPTEAELLAFFKGEEWQVKAQYSSLRKSGVAILQEGRWVLDPERSSADGKFFSWGHVVLDIEEGTVMTYSIDE